MCTLPNSSDRPHRSAHPAGVVTVLGPLALFLLLCAPSGAQTTSRLSLGNGAQANNESGGRYDPPPVGQLYIDGMSVSADGRYVAFSSLASDLVPGDTSGYWDVFVRDRQTGSVIRASVGAGGVEANGASYYPSISSDGRYVAFVSYATNLVPNDTNGVSDIFVRDLQAGTNTLASVSSTGVMGDGDCTLPSISSTGRYVAFVSEATNLVPNDTNGLSDIFVRDLQSGTTTRVSVDSNGVEGNSLSGSNSLLGPSISSDGRFAAFGSGASNLVPGDTNNANDIFVHDLQTGATSRVSLDSGGNQGNSQSLGCSLSADGRYVAFESTADNLVAGDTNGAWDVFVHDRQTGTTTLVSWDDSGNPSDNDSVWPVISADGRHLAFVSLADDLVPGDTNGAADVFVQDLQTGARTRMSVDSAGTQANGYSFCIPGGISSDGRFTVFTSGATNLVAGDTNGVWDVFLHDLQTGATTRESVQGRVQGDASSVAPSLSSDARYVAFESAATNLVPGDTNGRFDIFLLDRTTGVTTLASVSSSGAQGNDYCDWGKVSDDGRFVAFFSQATNLVPGDNNGTGDVFVRDLQSGTTTLASVDSSGAQGYYGMLSRVWMSSNGRYVGFSGTWPFVAGDTNNKADFFVRDMQSGNTVRASVGSAGAQGDGDSYGTALSSDGRYAVFVSSATNLVPGDTNGEDDIFVHDFQTGATTRVSVDSAGAQANGNCDLSSISPDGRYVAFSSIASNLVPGDTNNMYDIFVHDLQTGATTRESVASNGAQANGTSLNPSISSNGRYLTFISDASNLVPGDANGVFDVFFRDRLTGQTTRASVSSAGGEGDQFSSPNTIPWISPDGRYVAFDSYATNLVLDDTNGAFDVFLRDRGDAAVFALFCYGDGSASACPCGNTGSSGHGCQNSAGTGGAILSGSGAARLSADTAHLSSSGELTTSTSILLQGPTAISPVVYGDGLRCVGGSLKRLFTHSAVAGSVTMPQGADLSISARSAAMGAPIPVGAARFYQVYYRDPSATFCPNPPGSTFNISNAIAIQWGP